MAYRHQSQTATQFILRSLIPYTRENLLLSFSPNRFFNELEKTSKYNRNTIKTTYYRAKQHGYLVYDDNFMWLTYEGLRIAQPYKAKKLKGNGQLLLIFDIPDQYQTKRDKLRRLLKSWDFEHVQKSVWATSKDYKKVIIKTLKEFALEEYVELYESARIYPK